MLAETSEASDSCALHSPYHTSFPIIGAPELAVLSARQRRRGCPTTAASPWPRPAPLHHHRLITRVTIFLFPAPDSNSLRLCRAEALVALGQHPQALEDLDAVCRAEPGQHEVSGGPIDWLRFELNLTVWEQFPPFLEFSKPLDSSRSAVHLPDPLSCKCRLQALRCTNGGGLALHLSLLACRR